MKKILITAAGGAPSINFTRSVRKAKESYKLIGIDCNEYTINRAETDIKELCPKAIDNDYISYINFLIKKWDIDFIHAQPDIEVGIISKNRNKLKCKTFLPAKITVRILRNKYKSYRYWVEKNIPVPATILIRSEADLREAYHLFYPDIWLREIEGAGGKGALSSPSFDYAYKEIEKNKGWGRYTAAERLTENTVTWMGLYFKGELIIGQGRKRLYWEHSRKTQSGVTGITGTGMTISDNLVTQTAIDSIFAIDKKPHGIFSVDMTYDNDGKPRLTEINIGKFFTTHHFFTEAGINFPEIYLDLAFGKKVKYKNVINPLKDGLCWIRGVDCEPKLISKNDIIKIKENFEKQRRLR